MEEPLRFDPDEMRILLTPEGPHKAFKHILQASLQPGSPLRLRDPTETIESSFSISSQSALESAISGSVAELAQLAHSQLAPDSGSNRKRKALPTGLSDESMKKLIDQYVTSASIESQRQWMGAQLRDRASACAPNFQSPFKNLRDAWNGLHVYHVFHQPSPNDLEKADFEHQVQSTLGEFSKWMVHALDFYSKTTTAQDKPFPVEEEVLLARLMCSAENEETQSLRVDIMRTESEIKKLLNPNIEDEEDEEGVEDEEGNEDEDDEDEDESDYDD